LSVSFAPRQLEGASFSQHRPGNAGKLVGISSGPCRMTTTRR
jgi:hypothetical protein